MTEIRDTSGKIICKVEEKTGQLDCQYKDYSIRTSLHPGQSILIRRDQCLTRITRDENGITARRIPVNKQIVPPIVHSGWGQK